ncbi:NAD(P)/FAD-dependent oxidoreductase [Nocardioides sp. HM23]|uniref:flavin monoamine oxidase family protein n=1 Tax=Nocardioides bizhenqiangii TaxID=3095076 RepID=UPI002ACA9ED3|nr:NAD(P)/FAD-dependent oxidoreductase [Nocardioides sp. HM23]MDZ5621063.1 NAD(P)/FAD-dependent oxidoreductase [Nocardioides sp. HM23]
MSARYDVVVIGGGFAGIAAAREAGSLGRSVLLVEALDRLGGRTWTTNALGTRIEMGGTDIHWLQPNVWAEAARYGLEIEEFAPPAQLLYLDAGDVKEGTEDEVFGLMDAGMNALAAAAREAYPRPQDPTFAAAAMDYDKLSLGEFLANVEMTEQERAMTSSFWAAACQAPLEEAGLSIALRWLALAGWDWQLMLDVISRYKINGGMSRLSAGMASDIRGEIRTGVRATAVVERDDHVEVTLDDGSAALADAVVVAVPVNVLSNIKFEPARAEFDHIAREGSISRGLKVICRIRGDRTPYMAFAPEGHPFVLVQYDRPFDGDHIAVAFGPDAAALDGTSPEEVQKALRSWMPDVEVLDVAHHDWTTDEMFLGTWAVPGPGQLRAQLDALNARGGRVVLAGADLANGSYALIDGAINTGIRAGRDAALLAGK